MYAIQSVGEVFEISELPPSATDVENKFLFIGFGLRENEALVRRELGKIAVAK